MSTIVAHTDPDTDTHRYTQNNSDTDTCTPVWESCLDDPCDRRAERK